MPIAVLSEYTEKEYEPLDPYSRFYPAMPVPVCFSDTALCTLSKRRHFFILRAMPKGGICPSSNLPVSYKQSSVDRSLAVRTTAFRNHIPS